MNWTLLLYRTFDELARPFFVLSKFTTSNFPYAGYVNGSSLNGVGSGGNYWSRTAYSANSAYYLWFNSSDVYPADYNLRYLGFSVRCVATT